MYDVRQICVSYYVMRFESCARMVFNSSQRHIKEQVQGTTAPVGNAVQYKSNEVECRPLSKGPNNLQYNRVSATATDDKD